MRYRRLTLYSGLFVLLSVVTQAAFAKQSAHVKVLATHSTQVIEKADGQLHYQVQGNDPYWVFNGASSQTSKASTNITFSLNGAQTSTSGNIQFEFFFKQVNPHNSKLRTEFDPLYRVKYSLAKSALNTSDQFTTIELSLPDELNLDNVNKTRLDIDNCKNCILTFVDVSETSKNINLSASQIINGASALPEQGLKFDVLDWRLNDLSRQGDNFTVTGNDPFLVSPNMAVQAAALGGVLIELMLNTHSDQLSATQVNTKSTNLQLFYSTEQHRFVERASTIVQLPLTKQKQTVFIPLSFLSEQPPLMQLLTGLRIDSDKLTQLNSIALISKRAAPEYEQFIPKRIYQRKIQRAGKRQILSGIAQNLSRDISFFIFYGLLLIAVAVVFRRAIK